MAFPNSASRPVTPVAAGILFDRRGRYLLARRPPGKVYAGHWELPGGKLEEGESALQALERELKEELGVQVQTAQPWLIRTHDYPHASVRLHLFRVTHWHGWPQALEGQSLAWQGLGCQPVAPLLPANAPILKALALPMVYGVSNASEMGTNPFLEALERALFRGLRLIQVREKSWPLEQQQTLAESVIAVARSWQAQVLINGPESLARQCGAAGIHLSAQQLQSSAQRPDFSWVGASCHTEHDLEQARRLGIDFVVWGPIAPTRSHPEHPGTGMASLKPAVWHSELPVLAIGGQELSNLPALWATGAHGLASQRAIWGGTEPIPAWPRAAREIEPLHSVPQEEHP